MRTGFLFLLWVWRVVWAADVAADATPAETNRLEFGIFWPPKAPEEASAAGTKPLLNGCVLLRVDPSPEQNLVARLRIVLSRPPDEIGRESWNSRLAFPEYDWMRSVRVWDTDNRWLWPNLPYLLRIHGIERVERYGGVDPGKGVDNDFAAVLVRKYNGSGRNEDPSTKRAPLVAAEWYPVGTSGPVDKQTIVHTAQSDEFTLHLGGPEGAPQGVAAIWLIYADFMGAKLPETWPKAPEFAGGILAYFEVQWDLQAESGKHLNLRQLAPNRSTGFNWEQWGDRARAARDPKATTKLQDVAGINSGSSRPAQSGKVEPGGVTNTGGAVIR